MRVIDVVFLQPLRLRSCSRRRCFGTASNTASSSSTQLDTSRLVSDWHRSTATKPSAVMSTHLRSTSSLATTAAPRV